MPAPGCNSVDRDQPEDKRYRGQHLEIDQRLERDPADLGHAGHTSNAVHHRAEDDRRDQHADRLDEGVAEWRHPRTGLRVERAERDAGGHRQEHQEPELQIERPRRRLRARSAESNGAALFIDDPGEGKQAAGLRQRATRLPPVGMGTSRARSRTARPFHIDSAGTRRRSFQVSSYSVEISLPV